MVGRPTAFFWGVSVLTAAGIYAIHLTQLEEREVGSIVASHMGSPDAPGCHTVASQFPPPPKLICLISLCSLLLAAEAAQRRD